MSYQHILSKQNITANKIYQLNVYFTRFNYYPNILIIHRPHFNFN